MDSDQLIKVLNEVLHGCARPISLHEPDFTHKEAMIVSDTVKSGWVSSVGKYVDEFEEKLQDLFQMPHAIAMVNGTSALYFSALLSGLKPGDEVIVPALTFVATASAVVQAGGIPHFVDSEEDSFGIDPKKLRQYLHAKTRKTSNGTINVESGRKIHSLIAVHIFGHPCLIEELIQICDEFQLVLIEDAAEAVGSTYQGKPLGSFAQISALSFNGNKTVTTGGGGAILLKDHDLAKRAKHLSTTAKLKHRWDFIHDDFGFNFRLPNLNAALGCVQLDRLNEILTKKRNLALKYRETFKDLPGVEFMWEKRGAQANFWLNVIRLKGISLLERNCLLDSLHDIGIQVRPVWHLLNDLPTYKKFPSMELVCAEKLQRELICLPSGPKIFDLLQN